ncbi:MAG: glycosyltransferase [Opitutaceae bacterium]
MIFFDTTKTGAASHRSGLTRVSARLRAGLGPRATGVAWNAIAPKPSDWFLTSELFSEEERPGFTAFLNDRRCRLAAIFHDAIPLKHPQITWPHSVARHPGYMKLLARFDRVWAVSQSSCDELIGFWRWQGIEQMPPVKMLALGADFDGSPRVAERAAPTVPRLLCLGIVEPRKNQPLILEVCAELWREGLVFELHVVGRVNPHFGRTIAARIGKMRGEHPGRLWFHEAADDGELAGLFATARATVFPTIAEGCGLPLLESLWRGVPCLCSDLPVLLENASGGGCLPVATNDSKAWKDALRGILTDDVLAAQLTREAMTRSLSTWQAAADRLAADLA